MIDFHNLQVWEKSHKFTVDIYRLTESFPDHELYGLISQIRRASVSIPSNIAEGCGKGGHVELKRYLEIAGGSVSEVEYQLLLARDLGYIKDETFETLNMQAVEIKKMLVTYIKKIKQSNN